MKQVRWLITGERDWTDHDEIARIIEEIAHDVLRYPDHELVIVHGDCPTGADRFAKHICRDMQIKQETFTVDHTIDGPWPAAGPRRNGRMCRSGPFAGWIAFWSGKRERSGTLDCVSQITALGVNGQVIAKARPAADGGKGGAT